MTCGQYGHQKEREKFSYFIHGKSFKIITIFLKIFFNPTHPSQKIYPSYKYSIYGLKTCFVLEILKIKILF